MGGTKGRRKAIRFPVQVPVDFSWSEAGGIQRRAAGRTYDVSNVGAFVLASVCPPVGAEVSYKLHLSGPHGGESAQMLEAVGQVLRVEHGGEGRRGFALGRARTEGYG
jgi:PilZ domain-containing protein